MELITIYSLKIVKNFSKSFNEKIIFLSYIKDRKCNIYDVYYTYVTIIKLKKKKNVVYQERVLIKVMYDFEIFFIKQNITYEYVASIIHVIF